MIPTPDQIESIILNAGFSKSAYREELVFTIIAGWEKARPKENLDGAFIALRGDLADARRQLTGARLENANLAADNAALHEALPEWIPITGEIPQDAASGDGFFVFLTESGKTWCDGRGNCSRNEITHYLSPSALAALPKREPEPEPEPEPAEGLTGEFLAWSHSQGLDASTMLYTAFQAGRESAK